MKLGLASARIRNQATLRAGLALVFALQIVGLCFCSPAAKDEHDCCPETGQTDVPGSMTVASLSAPAGTTCCPDGVAVRASLQIGEPKLTVTQSMQATVVVAWLVRSDVPARSNHTDSASAGRAFSTLRSPILRI